MTQGFSNNSTLIMPLSGTGAPTSTPSFRGQQYQDQTKGSVYTATGTTSSADWKETYFPPSYIRRTNGRTKGSTNTNIVIFGTSNQSAGTDITYSNSAANGDSFTINTSGIYSVSVFFVCAGAGGLAIQVGSSLNNSYTYADVRASQQTGVETNTNCSWTGYIAAGNVVYIWTNATVSSTYTDVALSQVTITRVG